MLYDSVYSSLPLRALAQVFNTFSWEPIWLDLSPARSCCPLGKSLRNSLEWHLPYAETRTVAYFVPNLPPHLRLDDLAYHGFSDANDFSPCFQFYCQGQRAGLTMHFRSSASQLNMQDTHKVYHKSFVLGISPLTYRFFRTLPEMESAL